MAEDPNQGAPPGSAPDDQTEGSGEGKRRRFRFPSAFTVLTLVALLVWGLTFIIPAGQYELDDEGAPIPGTYEEIPAPLDFVDRVEDFFLAPVNGLYGIEGSESGFIDPDEEGFLFGAAQVFLFVLAIGVFITVMFETGALNRGIAAATGADETGEVQVFCMLPAMSMSQLCFYKEFADASWVGPDNAPFSKVQRTRMKTVRGVTYIEVPDEYVLEYEEGKLETFMWHKDSMGAVVAWNQDNVTMSPHPDYQGTPWLIKAGLGGAAIGIQGAGVKRIRFAKQAAPVRPVIKVQDISNE